jgi:hypothetical protein
MAGYGSDNVVLGAAHSCPVEASATHALAARLPFAQILSRLDIWKTQRGHTASSGHSCLRYSHLVFCDPTELRAKKRI